MKWEACNSGVIMWIREKLYYDVDYRGWESCEGQGQDLLDVGLSLPFFTLDCLTLSMILGGIISKINLAWRRMRNLSLRRIIWNWNNFLNISSSSLALYCSAQLSGLFEYLHL
jgi:hypothetical protein